jgi:hypothetical protein
LTDPSAARWLKDAAGNFDEDLAWALGRGKFLADDTTVANGRVVARGLNPAEVVQHGFDNGAVLREAGGAYVQTEGGTLTLLASGEVGRKVNGFIYSPLAIFADAAEVVASSSTRANVSVLTTDAGPRARAAAPPMWSA